MKRLHNAAVAIAILTAMLAAQGAAFAQDRHYVRHNDWHRGGHIAHGDWNRGARIDYRSHRLRRPPRGYEWREVDGNYVLAAVATGLIASIVMANH